MVKAVDEVVNRKRKADKMINSPSSVKTSGSSSLGGDTGYQLGMLPPDTVPGAGNYYFICHSQVLIFLLLHSYFIIGG